MSDCFDRGCNGCDDCIDPEPTEKVCIDPMCACRGGPCAECPNGEREAALTADEAPANAEEFHTMILNHEDALTESGYEGMNHHWTRIALVNAFEAARTEAYAEGRKDEREELGVISLLLCWEAEELSEGQMSSLLDLDRVTLRQMRLDAIAAGMKLAAAMKAPASVQSPA